MSGLKYKFIIGCFFFLFFTFLNALEISGVDVKGNVRSEKSVIISHFENRKIISESEIDLVVKELISLKIFDDITVKYDTETKLLIFYVTEQPLIKDIVFKGYDDVDLEDIQGVLNVKKNELLNLKKIDRDINAIIDLYKEKGFLMISVEYKLIESKGSNEVTLEFNIKEGKESEVKKIFISGNKYLSDSDIKSVLMTKEPGPLSFVSPEAFKKENLEFDWMIINQLYLEQGFIKVKVSKPVVTISPDKRYIYIAYNIEEGDRYKVKGISFEGDKLESGDYPKKIFAQQDGDYYKHSNIIKDINYLKTVYGDEGYPFISVYPETPESGGENEIELRYHVSKGEKCYVERIDVTGNEKTRDRVVRRELKISEGELFNMTKQNISIERLKRTGFYEPEGTRIDIKKGSEPGKVKLLVTVKERTQGGQFQVGAGFSSLENFLFNASISQENFLGYGQTVSLSTQLSTMRQSFDFDFVDPYFFDRDIYFSTGIYNHRYNYESDNYKYYSAINQNAYGFNLTFGKYFGNYVRVTLGYRLSKIYIDGSSKDIENYLYRDIFTSGLKSSISFDNRDDRMFATEGILATGSLEMMHKIFGSDENIMRLSGNLRLYHNLFWDAVIKTNITTTYVEDFSDEMLPFAERIRIGGINSVRGYSYSSIGPSERIQRREEGMVPTNTTRDYVIGGNKKLVVNTELEVPLYKEAKLSSVLFLDCGNVWDRDENFFYINNSDRNKYDLPAGLFWSWGFGVRWVTPMAPLSFEWGFPLTPRPGDPTYTFEFNISQSF